MKKYYKILINGITGEFYFVAKLSDIEDIYSAFNHCFGMGFRIKSKPVKTSNKIIKGIKEYDGNKDMYVVYSEKV